jgi:hypothetical protein
MKKSVNILLLIIINLWCIDNANSQDFFERSSLTIKSSLITTGIRTLNNYHDASYHLQYNYELKKYIFITTGFELNSYRAYQERSGYTNNGLGNPNPQYYYYNIIECFHEKYISVPVLLRIANTDKKLALYLNSGLKFSIPISAAKRRISELNELPYFGAFSKLDNKTYNSIDKIYNPIYINDPVKSIFFVIESGISLNLGKLLLSTGGIFETSIQGSDKRTRYAYGVNFGLTYLFSRSKNK